MVRLVDKQPKVEFSSGDWTGTSITVKNGHVRAGAKLGVGVKGKLSLGICFFTQCVSFVTQVEQISVGGFDVLVKSGQACFPRDNSKAWSTWLTYAVDYGQSQVHYRPRGLSRSSTVPVTAVVGVELPHSFCRPGYFVPLRAGVNCNSGEGGPSSRCENEGEGGGKQARKARPLFFLLKLFQNRFLDKKWV